MHAASLSEDNGSINTGSIIDSLGDLQSLLIELHLNGDEAAQQISVANLMAHLTQVRELAEATALTGLATVAVGLLQRLIPYQHSKSVSKDLAVQLENWAQLTLQYLNEPEASEHWLNLIEFLNDPYWHTPITATQITTLTRLFEPAASQLGSLQLGASPQSEPQAVHTITDAWAAPPLPLLPLLPRPEQQLINADVALEQTQVLTFGSHADIMLAPTAESDADMDATLVIYTPQMVDAETFAPDNASSVAANADLTALSKSNKFANSSPADNELVTMIREELQGCSEQLAQHLENIAVAVLAAEPYSFEDYRWQVERLANASESIGLSGLHQFLARIVEASCLLESCTADEVLPYCEVLDRWPTLVAHYLEQPGDEFSSQALNVFITSADFVLPLEHEVAQLMLEQLRSPNLNTGESAGAARALVATTDMISLVIADDINPELLESLLQELPAQSQEFSVVVERLASGTAEIDDIQLAQRIAHTLKGSANTVGIRGIAELSHHLEDILVALQDSHVTPPKRLARSLVDAADCLEAMCETLLGMAATPAQAMDVLQDILDWANQIDQVGIVGLDGSDAHTASGQAARAQSTDDSLSSADAVFSEEVAEQQPAVPATTSLRVATTHIDELLRLSGESKIIGSQLKEGLRRTEVQLLGVRRQNQMLQQLVNELEHLVDIRGIATPAQQINGTGDFDALELDQYGELHTMSRRLAEVAMDSRQWSAAAQTELDALEELLLSQARHSNESQNSVLKMRMVPASTIANRLQRGARQTSRLLDKEVELIIKGADTLVDSDSLNQLIDPLMHLLRNAVDHGIESAEERVTKGKPPKGHLTIEFGREGNQVVVRCSDDGRGLDYAAIRRTAESRGLLTAGTQLTDVQLSRLIFQAGFSTRTEVTQTSGRGVGLDIVHSRVLELKGTLDVLSLQDRRCEFAIRLPATLLSAHALLVRNGKHVVAVASRGVKQIVDSRAIKVSMMGKRLSAQIGDQIYETHRLETLLGQPVERRDAERIARPALLVEVTADRICAILVQAVVDTVDLVIKPLGQFVPKSLGIVGATILGDGSVAPVMDIPELLRDGIRKSDDDVNSIGGNTTHRNHTHTDKSHANKTTALTVLVVDDSLSVRRSMEQLLRDAGYDVRLARDGLEAMAILQVKKPDIMLVDMEMPRMNGMELTTYVRNQAATRELPVIMITSRSTAKHRQQAQSAGVNHYMTKPYAEDALLTCINNFTQRIA